MKQWFCTRISYATDLYINRYTFSLDLSARIKDILREIGYINYTPDQYKLESITCLNDHEVQVVLKHYSYATVTQYLEFMNRIKNTTGIGVKPRYEFDYEGNGKFNDILEAYG